MSTMMSALGEATGMKPEDHVIGIATVIGAKQKVSVYGMALVETTSPALRHIYANHLQDSLAGHERASLLAIKKGWYNATASPETLVQQAVDQAKPALQ